jgi:hypothetical protein
MSRRAALLGLLLLAWCARAGAAQAPEGPLEAVRLRLEASRPSADGTAVWEMVSIVGVSEEIAVDFPVAGGTLRVRVRLTPWEAGPTGSRVRFESDGYLVEDEASWRSYHRTLEMLPGEAREIPLYESVYEGRRVGGRLTVGDLVPLAGEAPPAPRRLRFTASLVEGEGNVLASQHREVPLDEEVLFPITGSGPGRWAEVEVQPVLLTDEDLMVEVRVRYPEETGGGYEPRQEGGTHVLGPRDRLVVEGFRSASGEGIRLELSWELQRPAG